MILLEYNDFRIEKDKDQKKILLKKLGDYLEPKRNEYASLNNTLTSNVFFMLNKFYIRHNNPGNIQLSTDAEYILWYDRLFKMIIHLIRTKEINEIQNELIQYKS